MKSRREPWATLGIEPTSDARAIRRAYAAKLRITRPDEDAEGFQRLLRARDWALAIHHDMEPASSTDRDAVAEPPVEPVSADSTADVDLSQPTPEPRLETMAGQTEPAGAEPASNGERIDELLKAIGGQRAGHELAARWAAVFDALEQSSLQESEYLTWMVLNRLAEDLRRDVPGIPDLIGWGTDMTDSAGEKLGDYADILRDLETRFRFLNEDKKLFEYLEEDLAVHLINGLTIAAGRARPMEFDTAPAENVARIDRAVIDAAFEGDIQMQLYYLQARKTDRYPWSFSVLALLFPAIFAFNYRLYRIALIDAVAVAALITVLELDVPLIPLALGLHGIIAVSLATRWRRMRLEAVARKVRHLVGQGLDRSTVEQKLTAWGQQNRLWAPALFMLSILARTGFFTEIGRFISEFK